jgi:hypothetical protein
VACCSTFQNVHTSSGSHPASYLLFTRAIFPGVKLPGNFSSHLHLAPKLIKEYNYTIPTQYALKARKGANSQDKPFQLLFFFFGGNNTFCRQVRYQFHILSPDGSGMQYVVKLVGNYVTSQTWTNFAYTHQLPRHDTMKLLMVENWNVWSLTSKQLNTFSLR